MPFTASFDQGAIPNPYSNSMRWMGVDGGAIMSIGETPLDASCDKSFLDLGVRIGTELDSAHVSTVFFARWPTQACDSFTDLKNATTYGKVLGDFTAAASYFENIYDPGYGDAYEPDEYKGPWLEQAVTSGSNRPVSTFVQYWDNWYRLSAIRSLLSIAVLSQSQFNTKLQLQLDEIQNRLEMQTGDWDSDWDDSVDSELESIAAVLKDELGCQFINTVPWRHVAHMALEDQNGSVGVLHSDGAIKHAARTSDRCDAIIELSGFGRLFTNVSEKVDSSTSARETLIDNGESILRNEFFEVRMDRDSGGIRGVYFYGKRGNLFSQRLAVRSVDSITKEVSYSKMVCDSFEVTTLSPIASRITTSGSLIGADEELLAQFTQTIGLQRGRKVIDIEVKLSDMKSLDGSTRNYIANRIAWSDEEADLFCDIQGSRHAIRHPSIEAPHFIEVVQGQNKFALLTHGLPWHRRASKKMLDSILVVGNEGQTQFKFAVAVNPESAMQVATAEMHPSCLGVGHKKFQ